MKVISFVCVLNGKEKQNEGLKGRFTQLETIVLKESERKK